MTRRIGLAACQMGPVLSGTSRADVVGRLIAMLERAAAGGAALAVFPELAFSTFFPRSEIADVTLLDSFYEDGFPNVETAPLLYAARRLNIGFAVGFAELIRDGGEARRFNSMALVDRSGTLRGLYRKIHVPGSEAPEPGVTMHLERRYFAPGDLGFPVFDLDGVRVGLALCNDRRWPETYRMLCLNGAEVVLIGYNTPLYLDEAPALAHLRMFHNHLPMQAGAYQNTLWIAAAAKAGLEDGQALIGGSCIIAPTGEMAALATSLEDEVIVHYADLDLIAACRQVNFDFARYRRPDQYRRIGEA